MDVYMILSVHQIGVKLHVVSIGKLIWKKMMEFVDSVDV
jgi:hypothetical protein